MNIDLLSSDWQGLGAGPAPHRFFLAPGRALLHAAGSSFLAHFGRWVSEVLALHQSTCFACLVGSKEQELELFLCESGLVS